jgi:XRE family aerobic/anaerobic benzoate catabolism transcriptional regulator
MNGASRPAHGSSLLASLGATVRALRAERGWSRREFAAQVGLSERFLAQVEGGKGNPSIVSLARIASALGTTPAALLAGATPPPLVALLGLRGAGKSTVGRALAQRLGVGFVELDGRIEEAAGLSLAEIFELHGEGAYRRWEKEALQALIAKGESAVLATGGSIVTDAENFGLLRRSALTIWLKATPEEHWDRVLSQGDHRPMANDPLAMAQLRELLARREPLYRTADHTVVTSGAAVDQLVDTLVKVAAGGTKPPQSSGS